ncbi:MAG: peptidoglycan DD-metalloendopeptidase family protein [Synergistaceae bacterium]|nr:peptidoglycan DD-metalloendopeptidase family protein [Synergistaceae bacterium]
MLKKILAVFLILAIFMDLTAYAASIDSQIKSQKRTQSDMKKKIQQYNAIAREKSKQSKTLLGQLSRLRQDATASQAKMNDLEKENIKLQNSVGELNKKIARVRESINTIIKTLRARILDIYKYTPEENSLSLIMTSSNPHDALNTAYMLRCFARQDSAMIEELAEREAELNDAKKKLENSKSQILRQTEELKKKRAEYDSTIKKTDSLLRNVQSEQKKAESAAKELEAAQRAVGSKINSLMKQKKNQTAKKNSSSAKSQSAPASSQSSVKTLIWPVNGTVTMQYGSRVHPVFKTKIFNSGIDIKAAAGTPVKAAGPGEVLYQGWLKGFGQVIIIDHGGDLSTVYAHLGGASVREGNTVKAGTVIGRVGNSGTDSEFGLHFEVRKNGSAQNPMNFLKK